MSALAYVLFALQQLFREFGAVELNVALTALVIRLGAAAALGFWHQARAAVVRPLPDGLRERLRSPTARALRPNQPHKPTLHRAKTG